MEIILAEPSSDCKWMNLILFFSEFKEDVKKLDRNISGFSNSKTKYILDYHCSMSHSLI